MTDQRRTGDAPKLILENYDAGKAQDAQSRGCLFNARVRAPDGATYPVAFIDPMRLTQDLVASTEAGEPLVAIPALIVIPIVTRKYMERAVALAWTDGFFSSLVPITDS